MPTLRQLDMLDLDEVAYPCTYRFVCQGGRNYTTWEMSVDAPALNGHLPEAIDLGRELFNNTIATAICRSVFLVYYDYCIWKGPFQLSIGSSTGQRGRHFDTPAPRDKSAVLSFNTGHADSFGRRRHYLFGMPFNWQDGELLTERGWDGAMSYAHLLTMGLQSHFIDGGLQHLITYWGAVPPAVGNLFGVGFRRVSSYNVFQYVEKAPDISANLWPPAHG